MAYQLLQAAKLEVDGFPNQGIAAGGYWIRPAHGSPRQSFRGEDALNRTLALPIETVLDVGSGSGVQARAFEAAGKSVTCVDFGVSAYAQADDKGSRKYITGDFNSIEVDQKYDLVWCSHTLEHQRNAGSFLEKIHAFAGKFACITVPVCHRAMWSGHLSLWTPGLLAYNIAMCGMDVSDAELIYGFREFSLLYEIKPTVLPPLTYDQGDIDALKRVLPPWLHDAGNSWPNL